MKYSRNSVYNIIDYFCRFSDYILQKYSDIFYINVNTNEFNKENILLDLINRIDIIYMRCKELYNQFVNYRDKYFFNENKEEQKNINDIFSNFKEYYKSLKEYMDSFIKKEYSKINNNMCNMFTKYYKLYEDLNNNTKEYKKMLGGGSISKYPNKLNVELNYLHKDFMLSNCITSNIKCDIKNIMKKLR